MMTLSVNSTLSGIHPRSELTVKTSRDYDRGRTTKEALDSAFKSDSTDLVNLQLESGLTRISDGQLLWQDFIRPFSESLVGLRSGADLSRWFDTNSFYRKPSVIKKIAMPDDPLFLRNYLVSSALDSVKGDEKRIKKKLTIMGPYSLANLVSNQYYKSRLELVHDFARILKKALKGISDLGFGSVQLNEPSLVYRYGESALTNRKELKIFCSAYEDNLSNPPVEVYLHTYFGDCSKILKDLIPLDGVSAIGIDFTQTSLKSIENVRFKDKALGCGCIDGRNSLVEPPDWIAKFCLEAINTLKPSGLVVLPSSELKYLPRTCADDKIRSIAKACEILEKAVE